MHRSPTRSCRSTRSPHARCASLIADSALPPPTRSVFSTTIVAYVDRLDVLAQRVQGVSPGAEHEVLAAARRALSIREAFREVELELVRARASSAIADADRSARDRNLDERTRRRFSALRRDREMLAARPELIATPLEGRLAKLPDQLDEPEPEIEKTFADMFEMD